jgi:DNA-binding MarR family transcriptional regulator
MLTCDAVASSYRQLLGRTQSYGWDDQLSVLSDHDELAIRRLPLRAIVALDILARCDGRLHVAAKMQGVSAAALSTQITRLETTLGADVIQGTQTDRRRFELTDEGRALVEALRAALPALMHLSASFREAKGSSTTAPRRRDQKRERRSRGWTRPSDVEANRLV